MTDLGIPVGRELAKHDFLDRPLPVDESIYALGEFLYRQADAGEFLQFLQFLCQNQRSAAGVLRLMGAVNLPKQQSEKR